jgi:hypothetical protein
VRIGTSYKRMILAATSGDKRVLRGIVRLIHPTTDEFDSRKFEVATCASIAPLLWPHTSPRRIFFSISSTVATPVTRIRYEPLRLVTVRSSENLLR